MKKLITKIRSLNRKQKTTVVLALIFVMGILALMVLYSSRSNKTESEIVTYSTDEPSEERPGDDYKWKGEAKDPKKIKIPSIGVDAFIQKVGVDQKKEVAVPNNLFMVGWFVDTVRPGEKGLSLIDGHVSGRRNDGIFKDLEKLKEGDEYSVELGDGTTINYKVIGKQSAPVNDSVGIMFSQNPKVSNQLNLVTCSGKYDEKTRSYTERLTVMSEQIQ